MASRNFGIGSRDLRRAGEMALRKAQQDKAIAFATEQRYNVAWTQFSAWAKAQGIKHMERITREQVIAYGKELAAKVEAQQMSRATAQGEVSAVNRVLQLAGGKWQSVSPTKDCGIPDRVRIREDAPAMLDRQEYETHLGSLQGAHSERAIAVCELARELGLRSKEASLLNAHKALSEAKEKQTITVAAGTKGGLARTLHVSSKQMAVLERAAAAQGNARAVMPPDQNWKQWQAGGLRDVREAMGGLHELRAAYACERYAEKVGHSAPCTGQVIIDKTQDKQVRAALALELGHYRIDVVAEYVGGRK